MSTLQRAVLVALVLLQAFAHAHAYGDPGGEAGSDIFRCIQEGNLKKVKELLAKNPKLATTTDNRDNSPIRLAASNGSAAIADALIAAGARLDIESAAALGRTREIAAMLKEKPWLAKPPRMPLHYAGRGQVEVVKLLLKHGADPNLDFGFANVSSVTALSFAMMPGNFEVVKLLCEHGAKLNVAIDAGHDRAFHYAVGRLDARFVKLFLDHKADPDEKDRFGLTPLHITAYDGSIDKAKILLDFKADVNAQTSDGATPLYFAAVMGRRKYCDFLLKHGARLDVYSACALGKTAEAATLLKTDPRLARKRDDRLRRTPLFWAARNGDVKLVELLLSLGAEVNLHAMDIDGGEDALFYGPELRGKEKADTTGETPLHLAAGEGHVQVVRLLLKKGADIDARDGNDGTPLHRAAMKHHAAVVKLLLEKGAAPDKKDKDGYMPLHSAGADTACIKLLIDAGANANAADNEGTMPLRQAAYDGNKNAAEFLLTHGATLDLFSACILGKSNMVPKLLAADPKALNRPYDNRRHETPLMLAAQAGHADIVRMLIERGADYHPNKVPYPSPLHLAARNGRVEVIKIFLDKGISVDARSGGVTLLMEAATYTQVETVRFLLSKKADVKLISVQENGTRHTALQCIGAWRDYEDPEIVPSEAERRREVELARLLIKAGADVNAVDQVDRTPLHAAVERGQVQLAKELLANGARVNARDQYGVTPLGMIRRNRERIGQEMIKRNWQEMIKLLRDKAGAE